MNAAGDAIIGLMFTGNITRDVFCERSSQKNRNGM